MICQKCKSKRVMHVNAKCCDLCFVRINGKESDGYVPTDTVFGKDGWGDYVEFDVCLDCGQMQGEWPNRPTRLETGEEDDA
jgi:hypothetical protein